ncbi:MAG: nitrate/nitrite transporter NrtS [Hyphomicrobiaceae bacterium]|jgi:hypothetical protein
MNEHRSDNAPAHSRWRFACACALSDGVPLRSLCVALVVGTVLNLINQGDAILTMGHVNWIKVALTYCVPYAVCTYGAVSSQIVSRGYSSDPGAATAKTGVHRA